MLAFTIKASKTRGNKMLNVQYQKVTQSLNYLLRHVENNKLDKLLLIKLLWVADRYHIRKFGRFVSEDSYVAMPKGPVASLALHIINDEDDYLPEDSIEYGRKYIKLKNGFKVTSLEETDEDFLSKSDKEALDFACRFNEVEAYAMVNFSHQFPEWHKHESTLVKIKTSIPMDPLDFFEDSKLKSDPFKIDVKLLELNKEKVKQDKTLRQIFQ